MKDYNTKYYQKHKKVLLKQQKRYYQKPEVKKKQKEYNKVYYQKPEIKKKTKEYHQIYNKYYYQENKEKIDKKNKKWKEKNSNYLKEYAKKYGKENSNKINKCRRKRYKTDQDFNIRVRLKALFGIALRKYTKTGKIYSSKKYGMDYRAIIEYLKPFPKNLKNYEIHHIKPLFTFKLVNSDGSTNLKEVGSAFAPENHKLLTIEEHKEIHRNF